VVFASQGATLVAVERSKELTRLAYLLELFEQIGEIGLHR